MGAIDFHCLNPNSSWGDNINCRCWWRVEILLSDLNSSWGDNIRSRCWPSFSLFYWKFSVTGEEPYLLLSLRGWFLSISYYMQLASYGPQNYVYESLIWCLCASSMNIHLYLIEIKLIFASKLWIHFICTMFLSRTLISFL
jgi:hypothetical protein